MRFAASLAMAFVMLAPAPAAAGGDWTWPVDGELATKYRNGDDPYAAGQHRGIDIAAPAGRQVAAAASGTVTFAGTVGSAGATVTVRTADGRLDTSYLHLGSIDVREGETVSAGAALGEVGTSGRGSIDQPHLHFGVREVAAGMRTVIRSSSCRFRRRRQACSRPLRPSPCPSFHRLVRGRRPSALRFRFRSRVLDPSTRPRPSSGPLRPASRCLPRA